MLGKLLKHEFLAMVRKIIPGLIGYVLLCVVNKLLYECYFDSYVYYIIRTIITLAVSTYTVIISFYPLYIIAKRMGSNIYGREGYLTNTLPVSIDSLIISKTLICFVWMLICNFVLYATSYIMSDSDYLDIKYTLSRFDSFFSCTLFIVVTLAGIIVSILFIFMCITLGYRCKKHKILSAVCLYVGIIIALLICAVLIAEYTDIFKFIDNLNVNGQLLLSLIVELISIIIMYLISRNNMKNHLNLE